MTALLGDLVDLVALVYHESRNVRHLIRAHAVKAMPWKYLIALPTNRNEAWAALQDVRQSAKLQESVSGALHQFEQRFHVSLHQLEELYAHPAWRHSSYGGNAWHGITKSVRRFAVCLDQGLDSEAASLHQSLQAAQHNTGSVRDKLRRLDQALPTGSAG